MRRLDLERGEAIQIVSRPSGVPDMERDPNRQAGEADRPAHSLGERQKPETYTCHGGQRKALIVPEAAKGENGWIHWIYLRVGPQEPARPWSNKMEGVRNIGDDR